MNSIVFAQRKYFTVKFYALTLQGMRTTELKIGNEKKESILVAGGKGFKVYTTSGYDGWILVIGRKVHLIEEDKPDFKTVAKYVNLRYQPIPEQKIITEIFNDLVESKSSTIDQ